MSAAMTSRASFNPLPPSKRGETDIPGYIVALEAGFNPLPPSKRGETTST